MNYHDVEHSPEIALADEFEEIESHDALDEDEEVIDDHQSDFEIVIVRRISVTDFVVRRPI